MTKAGAANERHCLISFGRVPCASVSLYFFFFALLVFLVGCRAIVARGSRHRTPFVLDETGGTADGLDDRSGGHQTILWVALMASRSSPLPMKRVVAGWGSNLLFAPCRLPPGAHALPPDPFQELSVVSSMTDPPTIRSFVPASRSGSSRGGGSTPIGSPHLIGTR